MCKRGNYFIAMYDKEDNYIRDFESIEECAIYFHTSEKVISCYLSRKTNIKNKYRLFKIPELPTMDLYKSL